MTRGQRWIKFVAILFAVTLSMSIVGGVIGGIGKVIIKMTGLDNTTTSLIGNEGDSSEFLCGYDAVEFIK